DEICTIKDGGCYQKYQGGAILWTQKTGAHISIGAIRSAWAATGYENGPLGYPTSDELATATGVYQLFEGGAIYWTSSTNATKVVTVNNSGMTSAQRNYLQSALPAAIAESQQYGVPVSVALGQSILESGWGGSTLSSRYNNYFGIKCSTSSPYQAGCVNMNSGEYVNSSYQILSSSFRTYSSPTNSFLDHGYFLTHNSRYRNAFNYTGNPDEFIRQVASAGYATDPNYAQKVINIMANYGLYQYNI
ncbi:amidase, partial [Propionibacterium ruminifibrarum]